MAISQSEFEELDPERHKIVDGKNQEWDVLQKSEQGVVLQTPGGSRGLFEWQNGIIVDSFGIDVTLNHSYTQIVPR